MKRYGYTKENFFNTHFSVKIAKTVAKHGHDVTLYVFWTDNSHITYEGVKIYFYKIELTRIFSAGFSECSYALLKRKFSSDTVIHIHEPNRLFFTLFYLTHRSNKIVTENHGTGITNPYKITSPYFYIQSILKRTLIPYFLRKCKACIVHNQEAYDNFISLGVQPENLLKSPNGIDPAEYRFFDKALIRKEFNISSKIVILYIGRIVEYKGIQELVKAYEKLIERQLDVSLVILGPLQDANLETLVKPYWKGFKQNDELQKWYSASDIICLPSYAGEGMPISIIEALYYNLAVVLTKSSSAVELSQYVNLIMVEPKNIDSLEEGLRKALNSDAQRCSNKIIRDLFNWERICREYIKYYK